MCLRFEPTESSTGITELFQASCPGAFHDSQARHPPPRCLSGTRVDLLREILEWIERSNKKMLWISGPAGIGKSAIAQTIAEICATNRLLGASFFFYYGAPDRCAVERLIPSIHQQNHSAMRSLCADCSCYVVQASCWNGMS